MISPNHRKAFWLVCRGMKEQKRKIILASIFFAAFILLHFIKAKPMPIPAEKPTPKQNENLEEEINDHNSWQHDEPANKPSTTVKVSILILFLWKFI